MLLNKINQPNVWIDTKIIQFPLFLSAMSWGVSLLYFFNGSISLGVLLGREFLPVLDDKTHSISKEIA